LFKDCKCGQRMLRDMKRCGECQEAQQRVDATQTIEGNTYRRKVAKRHSALTTLAGMRPTPITEAEKSETVKSGTKRSTGTPPVATPVSDEQRIILRIVETNRIMNARRRVRKAEHNRVSVALKEWMGESS